MVNLGKALSADWDYVGDEERVKLGPLFGGEFLESGSGAFVSLFIIFVGDFFPRTFSICAVDYFDFLVSGVRKDQIRPGGNDRSDDADADAFLEFIEPVLEAGECLQAVGAAVGEVGAGAVSLDEAQFPQIQTGSNIVVQIV